MLVVIDNMLNAIDNTFMMAEFDIIDSLFMRAEFDVIDLLIIMLPESDVITMRRSAPESRAI